VAATILVVGQGRAVVGELPALLANAGHRVVTATGGSSALRLLPTEPFELVISDLAMPEMDGIELCRIIKQAPATRTMPVILVTDDDDPVGRERALNAGADDVVVGPVGASMVLALVAARLEVRGLAGRLKDLDEVVVSLSRALDDRDTATGGHSERVAHWATQIGSAIGLAEDEITALYKAALLHDVGTVAIPQRVLAKAGPLDAAEFAQVRQHPEVGERLLRAIPEANRVLPVVRHHHEWIDGSGYPDGLAGEGIPLFARIVAVADAFVALTSERPYRQRQSRPEAIAILKRGAGRQWDRALVDRFVKVLEEVDASPSAELETSA
jgi:putative two-component system response regulator